MTTVVVSPGPSTPTTFSAQIPLPTEPANVPLPPVALVEITTTHPSDSAADTLAKLLSVDGAGSGLDADLLDGQHGTYYLDWANFTGQPATFPPTLPIAESDVINLVSDLAAKAPLADPVFTGDPRAPTPTAGDSDTSIATTSFVATAIINAATIYAPIASPTFTGDPKAVTVANTDSDTTIATTAFVHSVRLDQMAQPAASIGMNGQLITSLATPVNPTDAVTKAYVDARPAGTVTAVTGTAPVVSSGGTTPAISMAAATGSVPGYLTAADWAAFNGKAPLASPVFTGDPQAPTPAAADNDTSIATTAFVKAALVAGGAVPTAESRNRLVNPACQISQENGATGSGNLTANGAFYCVDQTYTAWSLAPGVVATSRNSPGVPNGSQYCIYSICNGIKASLAAADYWIFRQPIEGAMVADLQWGIAGLAKPVVVRFWFYSSVTGTFTAALHSGDFSRAYLHQFTVTTPSVFQKVEYAVPADTTGTWAKDNTVGMFFTICLAAGSSRVSGTVDAWHASSAMAGPAQINLAATGGAVAQLADIGLYRDPNNTGVAPPWQAPNDADELLRCMRYWQQLSSYWSGYLPAVVNDYYTSVTLGVRPRTSTNANLSAVSNAVGGFSATIQAPLYISADGVTIRDARSSSGTLNNRGLFSTLITVSARM